MAKIQLVIEIDEDAYEDFKWAVECEDYNWAEEFVSLSDAHKMIRNGKPLPKGHGRLIDADRLKIDNPLHLSLDIPYVTEDTVEDIIDHAPTIIEAEKEANDG